MSTENRQSSHAELQLGTASVLRDTPSVRGRTMDDDPSPEQMELYRRMPGTRRLKLAEQMFWTARRLKTAGVRHQHPDWPDDQVIAEVNRIFRHVRD